MRKVRLKKLRARFREIHGRAPSGPRIVGEVNGTVAYVPSEIRRLKKASHEV